jgi:hypothetical protein
LLVKGTSRLDGNLFFEVYYPGNAHRYYSDKSEKGKNRPYRADDLSQAITNWWEYLIVVYPTTSSAPTAQTLLNGINVRSIPHMWGK